MTRELINFKKQEMLDEIEQSRQEIKSLENDYTPKIELSYQHEILDNLEDLVMGW